MGDGRAEGSSAIGDGGQAATSLTPDIDGTGPGSLLDSIVHIFESSQLEGSLCRGLSVVISKHREGKPGFSPPWKRVTNTHRRTLDQSGIGSGWTHPHGLVVFNIQTER